MSNKKDQKLLNNVMKKIDSGEVKIRPRRHYVFVTASAIVGMLASVILTIYLTNYVVYKLRLASVDRPAYGLREKLDALSGSFPWPAFLIGILSIFVLIWLLKKFDFTYRFGRWFVFAVISLSVLLGVILAYTNINNHLQSSGPLRGAYGQQNGQSQQKMK